MPYVSNLVAFGPDQSSALASGLAEFDASFELIVGGYSDAMQTGTEDTGTRGWLVELELQGSGKVVG